MNANLERSLLRSTSDEVNDNVTEEASTNGMLSNLRGFDIIINQHSRGFHMLPVNFSFTACARQKMWANWWVGIAVHGISPLRHLKSSFLDDVPITARHLVHKAALVIESIVKVARKYGYLTENTLVCASNYIDVWNLAYRKYLSYLYSAEDIGDPSFRADDKYYTTLHKRQTKKTLIDNEYTNRFEIGHNSA